MSIINSFSPVVRRSPSYQLTRSALLGQKRHSEVIVYQASPPAKKTSAKILTWFLDLVLIIAFMVGGAIFVPKLVYAFYDPETIVLSNSVSQTALGGDLSAGPGHSQYSPEINPNLPTDNWLEIPLIGVRSEIRATSDPAEALDQGVWLDAQFGVPGEGKTVVLAAHRYGWQWWWRDEYWRYNSFYNLPETQPGDLIEITYGQRKFVYEIYLATEGEEITDFSADLILYTCKFLNSPVRYFRYARLLDPTQNSQSL